MRSRVFFYRMFSVPQSAFYAFFSSSSANPFTTLRAEKMPMLLMESIELPATWGAAITCSSSSSGELMGGSVTNASIPAPAI